MKNCRKCGKRIKEQYIICYGCMVTEGHFEPDTGAPAKTEQDLRDNKLKVRDAMADKFLAKH